VENKSFAGYNPVEKIWEDEDTDEEPNE